MLDLQSPRWGELDGTLAAQLIQQVRDGDSEAYAELFHQTCHQFTVSPAAYAVVPHLVDLAAHSPQQLWPLVTIGSVVAARAAHPNSSSPIPDDLRDDYEQAVSAALPIAASAIGVRSWDAYDSQQLLASLAAFHGLTDLAMHLFLSGPELCCPECGELIQFGESD